MAKYYWLKLERQFFKRHDIQLLRKENRQYVEIYLELMAESIDHEGALRYSDDVPYTYEDLAQLVGCDLKLFKKAMITFKRRRLITEDKNGTIWPSLVTNRFGHLSGSTERMRRLREKNKNTGAKGDVTHSSLLPSPSNSISISSEGECEGGIHCDVEAEIERVKKRVGLGETRAQA